MRILKNKGFFGSLLVGFFCAIILTIQGVQAKDAPAKKEIWKSGTFSSLYYDHEDTGDLNGVELRIVYCKRPGDIGYQGTIQFAEGVPFRLNLIKKIEFTPENKITFSFTLEDGSRITFKGEITEKEIKGSFSNGFWNTVVLKRKTSYWDKK